jgi:hypothetical protein
MRRGYYVRITSFRVDEDMKTPDLSTLAMLSQPCGIWEGWLTAHVVAGAHIDLTARYRHGEVCLGRFRSARIIRISGQYVLTKHFLYALFRVPPSRKESFGKFA